MTLGEKVLGNNSISMFKALIIWVQNALKLSGLGLDTVNAYTVAEQNPTEVNRFEWPGVLSHRAVCSAFV